MVSPFVTPAELLSKNLKINREIQSILTDHVGQMVEISACFDLIVKLDITTNYYAPRNFIVFN